MPKKMTQMFPALLLAGLLLATPALALPHGDDHHHGESEAAAEATPSAQEQLAAMEESMAKLSEEGAVGKPRNYEERLKALEERQAEIYHTLGQKKAAGLAEKITERLTISGLIEVEGSAEDVEFADGTTDAGSDLVLATAQLGFGMKLNEHASGDLIFLFEEDSGSDVEVDEAAINLELGSWFARIGRQYLPFGVFHSHFISDPLTLELGETRETAILAGYKRDLFTLAVFGANGDAEKIGNEDHIRDWGASLTVTPVEGLELGGSYLADLADTNAELLSEYTRRVGGWSAFAHLERWQIALSGEILGATKSFADADLDADGDGNGDKPLAWNLEFAFYPRENVELALRYEGSDELAGFPERQYGVDVSWSPWEYTTLSLEYLRGEFDQDFAGDVVSSDGSPADKRDLVTAQIAFEF